jgi:hypothetical protein
MVASSAVGRSMRLFTIRSSTISRIFRAERAISRPEQCVTQQNLLHSCAHCEEQMH